MTLSTIAEIVRTTAASDPTDRPWRWGAHHHLRRARPALQPGTAALAAAGVGAEDRVVLIDKNSPEWFEVTLATAKLGAVNVSVNWRLAPPEMAQIIGDARASVVIVGPEFVPHIEKIERELTGVTTIVAIGDHDRWAGYETWIGDPDARSRVHRLGRRRGVPAVHVRHDRVAEGVMLTNDNFFKGDGHHRAVEVHRGVGELAMMPMFHIAGAGWSLVGMLRLPDDRAARHRSGRDPAGDPRVRHHALMVPAASSSSW